MLKTVMNVLMVPVLGFSLLIGIANADIGGDPLDPGPQCHRSCNECGNPVFGGPPGQDPTWNCINGNIQGYCKTQNPACTACVGSCMVFEEEVEGQEDPDRYCICNT